MLTDRWLSLLRGSPSEAVRPDLGRFREAWSALSDLPETAPVELRAGRLRQARSAALRAVRSVASVASEETRAVLAAEGPASDPWERALQGSARVGLGDVPAAIASLEAARAEAEALGDEDLLGAILGVLGPCYSWLDDLERGVEAFRRTLELARRSGDRRWEATALANLAFFFGEQEQAEPYAELTAQALVLLREQDDPRLTAHALCNLGGALTRLGRLEEARAAYDEGWALASGLDWPWGRALFLAGSGGLAMAEGRVEEGQGAYQLSIEVLRELGDRFQQARHQRLLGGHLVAAGRSAEALVVLRACVEECRASQHRVTLFQALDSLSVALEAEGDPAGALAALREHVTLRDGDQRSRLGERVRLAELRLEAESHRRDAARERARALELERLSQELQGSLEVQRLLQQQLLEAARTDPLTGLANRRHHASAPPESSRGRSLAVALVDLDHFKSVNDRFGHPVGDEVLVETARRLKAEVRGRDTVFRWGGEEFCIAMPDTDATAAAAIGERLVRAFAAAPVRTAAGDLPVTVSVGVAASEGDDFSALLERADQAMYDAKRLGRCRVVSAAPRPG